MAQQGRKQNVKSRKTKGLKAPSNAGLGKKTPKNL